MLTILCLTLLCWLPPNRGLEDGDSGGRELDADTVSGYRPPVLRMTRWLHVPASTQRRSDESGVLDLTRLMTRRLKDEQRRDPKDDYGGTLTRLMLLKRPRLFPASTRLLPRYSKLTFAPCPFSLITPTQPYFSPPGQALFGLHPEGCDPLWLCTTKARMSTTFRSLTAPIASPAGLSFGNSSRLRDS